MSVSLSLPYSSKRVIRLRRSVSDCYHRGGVRGMGLRLPGQSLSARPLHLTGRVRTDLIAFLEALTDT